MDYTHRQCVDGSGLLAGVVSLIKCVRSGSATIMTMIRSTIGKKKSVFLSPLLLIFITAACFPCSPLNLNLFVSFISFLSLEPNLAENVWQKEREADCVLVCLRCWYLACKTPTIKWERVRMEEENI